MDTVSVKGTFSFRFVKLKMPVRNSVSAFEDTLMYGWRLALEIPSWDSLASRWKWVYKMKNLV